MEIADIYGLLHTWGYPVLLGLLLLTAIGSPIPEDLLLIAAGYLVFAGILEWSGVIPVTLLGVIASDTILYAVGRHLPWRSGTTMEDRVLSPRRLRRATRWFDRLGPWTVFIARLVPGTRVLVFVTAGIRRISVWQFLTFDVLGACIWVPLLLFAGHFSGDGLGELGDAFQWLQRSAVLVLMLITILIAAWLRWGREESKL